MIESIPNVYAPGYPELHEFIARYASRYEYRVDGSSLWEGRVRSVFHNELPAELRNATAWPTGKPVLPLEVPEHFMGLPARIPIVRGWFSLFDAAYVITQDTDLFIVQHVDENSFCWDLARVAEIVAAGRRCRETLCGYEYLSDYADWQIEQLAEE